MSKIGQFEVKFGKVSDDLRVEEVHGPNFIILREDYSQAARNAARVICRVHARICSRPDGEALSRTVRGPLLGSVCFGANQIASMFRLVARQLQH